MRIRAAFLPTRSSRFGHGLRSLWSLDPAIHFLNHGSYGAAPRHVLAEESRWRDALEREPVRFMVDELPAALRAGGARLVIIDHIFSPLAVVTPIDAIVPLCRERGASVLVDGAHAPGLLHA